VSGFVLLGERRRRFTDRGAVVLGGGLASHKAQAGTLVVKAGLRVRPCYHRAQRCKTMAAKKARAANHIGMATDIRPMRGMRCH
jgi:hypothetical protein